MFELTPTAFVGYLASALVVISLTRTSVVRLRVLSFLGATTFVAYGVLIDSVPVIATNDTARSLQAVGIPAERVPKVGEGRPNVVDLIAQGKVDLIVNTPTQSQRKSDLRAALVPPEAQLRGLPLPVAGRRTVGYRIRSAALKYHVPYVTTLLALRAAVGAIRSLRSNPLPVRRLAMLRSASKP